MNNTKQLTIAWIVYTGDHGDQFAAGGMVAGGMDWLATPDNTNSALLLDANQSPLASYAKSAEVWHCPADKFKSSANPGPRVRSLSVNSVLGNKATTLNQSFPGRMYMQTAKKWSDLNSPGPSMVFAFLDEHPDSLNDALFVMLAGRPPVSAEWQDLPSSHHCGSGSLSFTDGHSEIHKWLEQYGAIATVRPVTYNNLANLPCRNSRDYAWMNDRMPYLQQ
jgi:hypothetical protein